MFVWRHKTLKRKKIQTDTSSSFVRLACEMIVVPHRGEHLFTEINASKHIWRTGSLKAELCNCVWDERGKLFLPLEIPTWPSVGGSTVINSALCQYVGKVPASNCECICVTLKTLFVWIVTLVLNLYFSCCITACQVNAYFFELPLTAACIFMNAWFVSLQFHIQSFGALEYSHSKDESPPFSSSSSTTTFSCRHVKLVISSHISTVSELCLSSQSWLLHALLSHAPCQLSISGNRCTFYIVTGRHIFLLMFLFLAKCSSTRRCNVLVVQKVTSSHGQQGRELLGVGHTKLGSTKTEGGKIN